MTLGSAPPKGLSQFFDWLVREADKNCRGRCLGQQVLSYYSIQRMEDDISTTVTAGGWPKRWQADADVRQEWSSRGLGLARTKATPYYFLASEFN